jgi:hypothetical protein
MLRVIVIIFVNILLLPVNIVLLIPRLIYKILINNKAGFWITFGGKKTIIETDGNVKIK